MSARDPSPTRLAVIAAARALVGVRFWWHGRTRGGLDCYGLLWFAGRAAGFDVPDAIGYSREEIGDAAMAPALAWFEQLDSIDAARPGDALAIDVRGRPRHYALLVAEDRIVHANLRARRVTESRLGPDERRNVVGAFRFPGVDAHG